METLSTECLNLSTSENTQKLSKVVRWLCGSRDSLPLSLSDDKLSSDLYPQD